MNSEHILSVVDAYFERFNVADAAGIANLYTDDAIVEDPYGTPAKTGKREIAKFYEQAVKSGATLTRQGATRIAGDRAAFAFTVTMDDFESTGEAKKRLEIDVIDTFEFNAHGKITKMTAYWDASINLRKK